MAKSVSHKRAQRRAAGKGGTVERKQPGGTKLDALSAGGKRATEVERSGDPERLRQAARRLKKQKSAGATQAVLQVPNKDLDKAAEAMRAEGVKGTVKNMSGTRRRSVR